MLNEVTISKAIITAYMNKLMASLELDVAIVGGGPSGLVAGYYLAKAGRKVSLFESKLSIGGGMWGGGMMFNEIVVQEEARKITEELGIRTKTFEPGYYTADSIDAVSTLIHRAIRAGLTIFNLIYIEDIVFKNGRVCGLVINYAPVQMAKLHVDPLTIHSSFVLDSTGHPANVTNTLARKMGVKLNTETGGIMGERSMDADSGEMHTVKNTKEVFPGLFVSGMAANQVYGGYRMGPVFGGMLLSGKKAASEIMKNLKNPVS
ncbi:MAG: sulfide-dependent adenosine diphosphate thiazole synthase [Syntrophorhabdus sp.]|jgi:thiamine thiazole synthase